MEIGLEVSWMPSVVTMLQHTWPGRHWVKLSHFSMQLQNNYELNEWSSKGWFEAMTKPVVSLGGEIAIAAAERHALHHASAGCSHKHTISRLRRGSAWAVCHYDDFGIRRHPHCPTLLACRKM